MEKIIKAFIGIFIIISLFSCNQPTSGNGYDSVGVNEDSSFDSASNPGDTGILTFLDSYEEFIMVYANNQASITYPTGTDDSGTATITEKFWMAEAEFTNFQTAEVLQWAYDNGWFSSTVSEHNGLDSTTVQYGGQELIDLDSSNCNIVYNESGTFSVKSGYTNKPMVEVSWYGAIMLCNWMTEMRDKNTDNVVYSGIDTTWTYSEISDDMTQTGYRLPSRYEWGYAARYKGSDDTYTVSGYTNPYFTKGNTVSGGEKIYSDTDEVDLYAVSNNSSPTPTEAWSVKSKNANTLGIYDISGNVEEWCFDSDMDTIIVRGASYENYGYSLQLAIIPTCYPYGTNIDLGFRLCRTANN